MRRLSSTLLLGTMLALASCGSGIFGGVLAGNRGGSKSGSGSAVKPPGLALGATSIPLIASWLPPLTSIVTIRIANFTLPGGATPFVTFENTSIGLERSMARTKATLIRTDPVANTTTLTAFLDINLVRGLLGSVRPERDISVLVSVEVGGKDIATPVPLLLVQPGDVTSKDNTLDGAMVVTVDGVSRFSMRAKHLLAKTSEAAAVGLSVIQRNYAVPRTINNQPNPDAQRVVQAPQKTYDRSEGTGISSISGIAPPVNFPGVAKVLAVGPRAGVALDTGVLDLPTLIYVPTLRGVNPASISIDGGTQARLIGRGLLPAENEGQFRYRFEDIQLTVLKGGSSSVVPATSIVEEDSSEQVVVFRMPPSPDGLPGQAALAIEQLLGDERKFRVGAVLPPNDPTRPGLQFGITQPLLGPFVNILPVTAVGLASGRFRPTAPWGDDLAILSEVTGIGQVSLMRCHGIGLYRQAGRSVRSGTVATVGIAAGAFDKTGVDDVVAVGGRATASILQGMHTPMFSDISPGSIIKPFKSAPTFTTRSRVADHASGDFDKDGLTDLVVLPASTLTQPELWSGVASTNPQPTRFGLKVAASKVHAADFDGDGNLDVAIAEGVSPWRVWTYRGTGTGSFRTPAVASYRGVVVPTGGKVDGLFSYTRGSRRDLVVVTRGDDAQSVERALLIVMRYDARTGGFADVRPVDEVLVPGSTGFDVATTMDIVGDKTEELIATKTSSLGGTLRAFALGSAAPVEIPQAVAGLDAPRDVVAMRAAIAWKDPEDSQQVPALIVAHSEVLDQQLTPVVSVFPKTKTGLATRFPGLAPVGSVTGLTIGDFDGDGKRTDVVLDDQRGLLVRPTQGPGMIDVARSTRPVTGAVLAQTLAASPWSGKGDLACWIESDGRLAVLAPGTRTPLYTVDLRTYLPRNLRSLDLDTTTRILVTDPDSDGRGDLCVFLQTRLRVNDRGTMLLFLRSKAAAAGKLPFTMPRAGLLLEKAAVAPATGNLASHSLESPGVELAYGLDNRIRFTTLNLKAQPGDDVFEFAERTIPVLSDRLVISPVALTVLGDLDGDGRDEVVYLMDGERRVDVLYNRILRTGSGFTGGLLTISGRALIYPGDAIGIDVADMNGDNLPDILIVATTLRGQSRVPLPCMFPNEGRGTFTACYTYPNFYLGDKEPKAHGVADLDGNGLVDLVLGSRILFSR